MENGKEARGMGGTNGGLSEPLVFLPLAVRGHSQKDFVIARMFLWQNHCCTPLPRTHQTLGFRPGKSERTNRQSSVTKYIWKSKTPKSLSWWGEGECAGGLCGLEQKSQQFSSQIVTKPVKTI